MILSFDLLNSNKSDVLEISKFVLNSSDILYNLIPSLSNNPLLILRLSKVLLNFKKLLPLLNSFPINIILLIGEINKLFFKLTIKIYSLFPLKFFNGILFLIKIKFNT